MRNTGIEYLSTDRKPVVLEELATLLPPLSEEQRCALETDILRNGCYTPVIVNEDMVIIDGHNRQAICEEHGIPYRLAVFAFDDLLEAKQWMVETQRGRRNLEPWELGKIALRLKPEIEAKAKANLSAGGGDQKSEEAKSGSARLPDPISTVDTRKELAESVGLGERTMGKVMQIDEHAPAAVKEALDKKELSVNQGYQITRKVQELPEEQREQAAQAAVEWAKTRKEIKRKDAEIDSRTKIAREFCRAFEKTCSLKPTAENVRCWVECTRMRPDEMEFNAREARKTAQVFQTIAEIIETELLPQDWRVKDAEKDSAGSGA